MANLANFQTINNPNTKYFMGPTINNKGFKGIDLQLQKNRTLNECEQACLNNDKCLYIDYNEMQKLCTLKGAFSNPDMVSGIKNADSYDILNKTELVGTPLTNKIVPASASDCQKLCTINNSCEAYSHTKNLCYMKEYDNAPNHIISWKLIPKISKIENLQTVDLMQCCMNGSGATNCGNNLPHTKNCDAYMSDFCSKHPYIVECKCINRDSNHQYNKVKSELDRMAGETINADCWYPPCKAGSGSYIPTNMTPITMSYYDSDLNRVVKIDNLRCVGTKGCNIKDIYNPDLLHSCTGMKLNAVAPKSPVTLKINDTNGFTSITTPTSNQLYINDQTINQPVSISQTPSNTKIMTGPFAMKNTYIPGMPPKSPTNYTPDIDSNQNITEQFDLASKQGSEAISPHIADDFLEGFDHENTSQYSSFKSSGNTENVTSNIYNSPPTIGHTISNGYQTLRRTAESSLEDIKSTLGKNYTNNPADISLKNTMQNKCLTPTNTQNNNINNVPLSTSTSNKQICKPMIDYNSLFLVVILLLILVAWIFWAKNK